MIKKDRHTTYGPCVMCGATNYPLDAALAALDTEEIEERGEK